MSNLPAVGTVYVDPTNGETYRLKYYREPGGDLLAEATEPVYGVYSARGAGQVESLPEGAVVIYSPDFDALREMQRQAWEDGKADYIAYAQGSRVKVPYPKNPFQP